MSFEEYNAHHLELSPEGPARMQMEHDFAEMLRKRERGVRDPYGRDLEWEERMPSDNEYWERVETLKAIGIKVRTTCKWGVLFATPMFMLDVEPLAGQEQVHDRMRNRYSRWTSERPSNELVHRHITIIDADKLITVPDWQRKLLYIYQKFNHKNLWLYTERITTGSNLNLDPERDPVASDPVIKELHSYTFKFNPIIDDKEHPDYWNDSNWKTVHPEMHISM